jgi:ATP-dependent exoDNAse (exonuclease V) beta subunit
MTSAPSDQAARERFAGEWGTNFAVVANAGSGKTTAVARRVAALAMSEDGAKRLARTAVVTFTNKAAAQIRQSARGALLERLSQNGGTDLNPLSRLDQAFFGTIHSFCILLARRHGSDLGIHLNPETVEEGDDPWEEFIEQDPMQFESLAPSQIDAFLRHASLDDTFDLARKLDLTSSKALRAARVAPAPPPADAAAVEALMAATSPRRGAAAAALERNKERARDWLRRYASGPGRLPIPDPEGTAAGAREHYRALFAPLKRWLADAGGVLAAELSGRYRAWRRERGIQTYADQVDTALSILTDGARLELIRAKEWSVILDEAQDTDQTQFSVLVEITRPPGAALGGWPRERGPGPGPGRFCMVGDAQQGIYSSRANLRNFQDHVRAFERGDGGECLTFGVTFRAPHRVVDLLNDSLPGAFGPGREYNLGLPESQGAAAKLLQARYERLVAGPSNAQGGAWVVALEPLRAAGTQRVGDRKLADEARQLARLLVAGGPGAVGARNWGDVCVLAPRRAWLPVIRGEFEAAGLKSALQMRRNRNGDNPVYAWLCGLLAVACDPDNAFEWAGVLREVFGASDAVIAQAVRASRPMRWDEPGEYPGPVREALETLGPFIERVDLDGEALGRYACELAQACRLAERARLADPEGGLEDELARLLSQADELGAGGAGPRAWLRSLLGSIDALRAAGRPAADALTLMTSHSAKGLEWPVVIPLGMWRQMRRREERGLRLIGERGGAQRVVLDSADMGPEAREAREREWRREQVRLLYVVLTRAKAALVVPWPMGQEAEPDSLAAFWGLDASWLDPLPAAPGGPGEAQAAPEGEGGATGPAKAAPREPGAAPAPALPERVLPHQLAAAPDLARMARHESTADGPAPARDAADPVEYGVWWHEMLERVPWRGPDSAVAEHGARAVSAAGERGFGARGALEWARLLSSAPWAAMRQPRWTALAEVGIFAPLAPQSWIDGVMDLVLHDAASGELWIVDWKTNQGREGEDGAGLLARLARDYEGQLRAYGTCAAGFFPGCAVRLWVYSTVAGDWIEVAGAG